MSNSETTINELVSKIKNTSEPVAERRAALRLFCQLRNESPAPVNQIPEDDLSMVVATMTCWSAIGLKDLSLQAASEAIAEGRARAKQSNQRKV
jgi:hypothetical protein